MVKKLRQVSKIRSEYTFTVFCFVMKRREVTRVGEDMGKRETLCTVGGTVAWCTTLENRMEVSQSITNRTAIGSSNPIVGVYPREMKIGTQRDSHTPCSL